MEEKEMTCAECGSERKFEDAKCLKCGSIMMEQKLSLEVFVPAKEELTLLAGRAKAVDIKDAVQVHEVRIELRDARISITKRGKELREGALKFQKEVISREKELVGLIEPEEERLKAIDEEFELRAEMEKRRSELPSRLDALVAIGDEMTTDEDEILAMDDNQFNEYRLRRIEAKLAQDKYVMEEKRRIELEEREAKIREEEKLRQEKIAEEDRVLKEARDRAQAEIDKVNKKLNEDRLALEVEKARIAAEELAKEKVQAEHEQKLLIKEREAKFEAEKQAGIEREKVRAEKFVAWQREIKFDESTDVIQWEGNIAKAYRFISEYKIEK